MGMVKVTNRHSILYRDRYDGKDYVFAPNEPVLLTDEAARHIFGYGDPDKAPYLARVGKLRTTKADGEGGMKDAMQWLNKFEFKAQVMKMEDAPGEVIPFADGDLAAEA